MKLAVKNFRIFFCNEFSSKKFENFLQSISLKKNSKIFYSQFHWKKLLKFSIVNFRLLKYFLLLNSLQKKISKTFYSQLHWKNISNFFQKIRKKKFLPKKKRGHRGQKCTFFPSKIRKIRHDLSVDFDVLSPPPPIIPFCPKMEFW